MTSLLNFQEAHLFGLRYVTLKLWSLQFCKFCYTSLFSVIMTCLDSYLLLESQYSICDALLALQKDCALDQGWVTVYVYMYYKILQYVNKHIMYVKPIIDYSASVWAPHTNWGINQLNSIQRQGARFVMSYYRCTSSVSNMLSHLRWSSIESQHKEACLIMFFKVIHGIVNLQLPTYIQHSSRP